MHLSSDVSNALQQIEAVKKAIDESDDPKLQMNTADSLKTILDILHDPIFRTIIQVQDSLAELNTQLAQHPSMLPNDFDIDISGNLILSVPTPIEIYDPDYPDEQRVPSAQLSPRSPNSPLVSNAFPASGSSDHLSEEGGSLFMKKSRAYLDISRNIDDERPQSVVSDSSKHASDLFASEWTEIQAIELVNDGTGLGFGIIGARASGVIVKTILPGGVADRDGRLQSGDHILQIGDVNLHDMVSEQVASVLRQSGTHVRLVVARPIDQLKPKYELESGCAIVPSRVVADPIQLERYLIAAGYPDIFVCSSTPSPSTPLQMGDENNERFTFGIDRSIISNSGLLDDMELPETEKFQVELTKDANGLGITIAGYVCEKEELSGIFVKSVSPGSAADLSGKIRVNDRIIEVDGQSLQGFSNHQAVEVLKKSGTVVNLRLERYLRGPKYEQLQQAIAANEVKPAPPVLPPTPSKSLTGIVTATQPRKTSTGSKVQSPQEELNAITDTVALLQTISIDRKRNLNTPHTETVLSTFGSGKKLIDAKDSIETMKLVQTGTASIILPETKVDENESVITVLPTGIDLFQPIKRLQYVDSELTPEIEANIIQKWKQIVGPDVQIVVAQIKKFATSSGLGISLEGTVDVEGGREVRPHHYIRSILPEGPVGQNGLLKSGDELLEVNGQRLLGMNHLEVVAILKELPQDVRMVCGRQKPVTTGFGEESLKKNLAFGGSQNLENLLPASDRLVKAKSDGSLATTGNTSEDAFSKLKSRSLEPLTGLAMWSSEPQIIELIKGERGLGFSILDYQDPLDPNDTLIVIRSLVPGGVAQLDGRLIPGDRLLFVNDINLENASLDQAVQALKGAPKGIVRIGVAKPLPMTDTSIKSSSTDNMNASSSLNIENTSISQPEPDVIPDWKK